MELFYCGSESRFSVLEKEDEVKPGDFPYDYSEGDELKACGGGSGGGLDGE